MNVRILRRIMLHCLASKQLTLPPQVPSVHFRRIHHNATYDRGCQSSSRTGTAEKLKNVCSCSNGLEKHCHLRTDRSRHAPTAELLEWTIRSPPSQVLGTKSTASPSLLAATASRISVSMRWKTLLTVRHFDRRFDENGVFLRSNCVVRRCQWGKQRFPNNQIFRRPERIAGIRVRQNNRTRSSFLAPRR